MHTINDLRNHVVDTSNSIVYGDHLFRVSPWLAKPSEPPQWTSELARSSACLVVSAQLPDRSFRSASSHIFLNIVQSTVR